MAEISSILNSVKKKLGLDPETTTEFDEDLIDYINMALSAVNQIGIGPRNGFAITGDSETWTDFVGDDPRLNMIKAYVQLRVKLIFDPPSASFVLQSYQDQLREYEWRLNFFVDTPNTFQITQ